MSSRFTCLTRATRLEAWALKKLTCLEIYLHTRMRREPFPRFWFAVSLLLVAVIAAGTGLLLSQKPSFQEANEVCQKRFAIVMPKLSSYQEEFWGNAAISELTPGLRAHHRFTVILLSFSGLTHHTHSLSLSPPS
jgi:hypothetical protein